MDCQEPPAKTLKLEACAVHAEASVMGYCQASFAAVFDFLCAGGLPSLLLCIGLELQLDRAACDGAAYNAACLLCCCFSDCWLAFGVKFKAEMEGGRLKLAIAGSNTLDLADCTVDDWGVGSAAALLHSAVECAWRTADKSKGLILLLASPLYETESSELSGGGRNWGKFSRDTCSQMSRCSCH